MPSPIMPLLALALALGAHQDAPGDPIAQIRVQLEGQRRELLANISDKAWMSDSARATIVRLAIERNWKLCAENEGAALAKASQRPARVLAEAALTACRLWEQAFVAALRNGADPYVDGLVSREDMAAEAQLRSRDAALARILMWRGVPTGSMALNVSAQQAPAAAQNQSSATPILSQAFPKGAVREVPVAKATKPDAADGPEIVIVGQPRHRCEVTLADRTLSEAQLAEKAKLWAATATPLRIVRPRGADYGCIAKIARHLNRYGVQLIQVVDP
jgi:hypothetical protein